MLSTSTFAPDADASATIAAMSAIDNSGLVGVSTQMSLVLAVIAARTASRSPRSAGVNPSPQGSATLANRR